VFFEEVNTFSWVGDRKTLRHKAYGYGLGLNAYKGTLGRSVCFFVCWVLGVFLVFNKIFGDPWVDVVIERHYGVLKGDFKNRWLRRQRWVRWVLRLLRVLRILRGNCSTSWGTFVVLATERTVFVQKLYGTETEFTNTQHKTMAKTANNLENLKKRVYIIITWEFSMLSTSWALTNNV